MKPIAKAKTNQCINGELSSERLAPNWQFT